MALVKQIIYDSQTLTRHDWYASSLGSQTHPGYMDPQQVPLGLASNSGQLYV